MSNLREFTAGSGAQSAMIATSITATAPGSGTLPAEND
jgi:hypothetical protein